MVSRQSATDEQIDEAKRLICEMCRNFYSQGWVSGTGGGMSIKVGSRIAEYREIMQSASLSHTFVSHRDQLPGQAKPCSASGSAHDYQINMNKAIGLFKGSAFSDAILAQAGEKIVMAPSGVQKERMEKSDMFVLDASGSILQTPTARPAPAKPPKLSECSPLFMSAYELRNAGAVLHSHSINAVMATLLQEDNQGKGCAGEFRVTNLEMIKGIAGHGYYDTCVVPIIDNTARECELTASLREAIKNYPKANAVLVKRHGVYVWGDNWIQAKTQAECYEYLFEAAVRLHSLGIDVSQPPKPPAAVALNSGNGTHVQESPQPASKKAKLSHATKPAAIVLDIEGTITPLSFVKDTLFPYAREHLKDHLQRTYETDETQADIALLKTEARKASNAAGVSHFCDLASDELKDKDETIAAVIAYVTTLMAEDKKSTGLKALQGHIWRSGFEAGELKGQLFPDVAPELQKWHAQGIKVYIFSSGSREAQRMLFANSINGDLRGHISGFFDTSVGAKIEAGSYKEIFLTLGVDHPRSVLFATDILKEADAADKAGWSVVLTKRPGNAALPPEAERYNIVNSMAEVLPY